MNDDWRDGFLFVGNELILDFLNTSPVLDAADGTVELVPDTEALIRWMVAASLTSAGEGQRLAGLWTSHQGLRQLHQFRELVRKEILRIESGEAPTSVFLDHLNEILLRHPLLDEVWRDGERLQRRKCFSPRSPVDLLAPLADSLARLLTTADYSRIRKCGACVLHFHDTSKKGTRHWCSMNLCGNRAKVAAYARRKKVSR